jgi:salicylate hydroxylase
LYYSLLCNLDKLTSEPTHGYSVALSKYPEIDVDIYEAATHFSEVGAGIGIWPRVWQTLAKMGLDEDLSRVTASKPSNDPCT